jgi:hypothetical protein
MDRFKKKAMPPPPAGPVPESAITKTNKRNVTYKIFKGYKPKDKRLIKKNQSLNIAWDLAGNKPSDAVVLRALDRFKGLDTKKRTPSEEDEFNTLRFLLNQINQLALDQSELDRIRGTIFTEEGFAGNRAQGTVSVNKHSNTLNGTIKRMKCTVCQSQSIIDKALNSKAQPRTCNICGASNSLEYEPGATNLKLPNAAAKANAFGSTNVSTNGTRNNANKGANAAAAAKAATEAAAKANAFGSTNVSTNGSRNNANKGANAAAAAKAATEAAAKANAFGSSNFSTNGSRNNANKGANAAAKAAIKARLIKVKNEKDRNVWIDPQTRDVYKNSNATSPSEFALGGPMTNDNISKSSGVYTSVNKGKYTIYDNDAKETLFINEKNYNKLKNIKGGTRKNRKNRRNTRKN